MIKCLGYILYGSAAHATGRVFMSMSSSPQPLLHPQSSQYWALTTSHSQVAHTGRIQISLENCELCCVQTFS